MRFYHVALGAIALATAACTSTPDTTNTGSGPYAVAVFNGSGQTAVVSQTLVTPLTVQVLNAQGSAASGIAVTWAVVSGGGSVAPTTSTTDATGHANTIFTLGATAGSQSVTATVANASSLRRSRRPPRS